MAVNPNIKKKADDIRNKIYGKEVRESLASGLEAISTDVVENEGRQSVVEGRQDSVESQWQVVSDEMTDKDVISAPEIIAARDGEANLKARLDKEKNEVTAQLANKVSKEFGKGLSTHDFTDEYKNKVDEINTSSYFAVDDTFDGVHDNYPYLSTLRNKKGIKSITLPPDAKVYLSQPLEFHKDYVLEEINLNGSDVVAPNGFIVETRIYHDHRMIVKNGTIRAYSKGTEPERENRTGTAIRVGNGRLDNWGATIAVRDVNIWHFAIGIHLEPAYMVETRNVYIGHGRVGVYLEGGSTITNLIDLSYLTVVWNEVGIYMEQSLNITGSTNVIESNDIGFVFGHFNNSISFHNQWFEKNKIAISLGTIPNDTLKLTKAHTDAALDEVTFTKSEITHFRDDIVVDPIFGFASKYYDIDANQDRKRFWHQEHVYENLAPRTTVEFEGLPSNATQSSKIEHTPFGKVLVHSFKGNNIGKNAKFKYPIEKGAIEEGKFWGGQSLFVRVMMKITKPDSPLGSRQTMQINVTEGGTIAHDPGYSDRSRVVMARDQWQEVYAVLKTTRETPGQLYLEIMPNHKGSTEQLEIKICLPTVVNLNNQFDTRDGGDVGMADQISKALPYRRPLRGVMDYAGKTGEMFFDRDTKKQWLFDGDKWVEMAKA